MTTHSSVLAWRIPRTAEPDELPSMGLQSWTRLKRLSSSSSICVPTHTHTHTHTLCCVCLVPQSCPLPCILYFSWSLASVLSMFPHCSPCLEQPLLPHLVSTHLTLYDSVQAPSPLLQTTPVPTGPAMAAPTAVRGKVMEVGSSEVCLCHRNKLQDTETQDILLILVPLAPSSQQSLNQG